MEITEDFVVETIIHETTITIATVITILTIKNNSESKIDELIGLMPR